MGVSEVDDGLTIKFSVVLDDNVTNLLPKGLVSVATASDLLNYIADRTIFNV